MHVYAFGYYYDHSYYSDLYYLNRCELSIHVTIAILYVFINIILIFYLFWMTIYYFLVYALMLTCICAKLIYVSTLIRHGASYPVN